MAPGRERHFSLDRRPQRRFDDHLLRRNLRVPRSIAKATSARRCLPSAVWADPQCYRYRNCPAPDDGIARQRSSTDVRHRTNCHRQLAIGEAPPSAPGIARNRDSIGLTLDNLALGSHPPALQIVQQFFNASDAECPRSYSHEGDSIYGSPPSALSYLFPPFNSLEQVVGALGGHEGAIACAPPFAYHAVKNENSDSVPFAIDHIPDHAYKINWIAPHLESSWIMDWSSTKYSLISW